jgi:hypothetical protein
MIGGTQSDCKYVEIFTHQVGRVGTPRRTMFIRGKTPNILVALMLQVGTRRLKFSNNRTTD